MHYFGNAVLGDADQNSSSGEIGNFIVIAGQPFGSEGSKLGAEYPRRAMRPSRSLTCEGASPVRSPLPHGGNCHGDPPQHPDESLPPSTRIL